MNTQTQQKHTNIHIYTNTNATQRHIYNHLPRRTHTIQTAQNHTSYTHTDKPINTHANTYNTHKHKHEQGKHIKHKINSNIYTHKRIHSFTNKLEKINIQRKIYTPTQHKYKHTRRPTNRYLHTHLNKRNTIHTHNTQI